MVDDDRIEELEERIEDLKDSDSVEEEEVKELENEIEEIREEIESGQESVDKIFVYAFQPYKEQASIFTFESKKVLLREKTPVEYEVPCGERIEGIDDMSRVQAILNECGIDAWESIKKVDIEEDAVIYSVRVNPEIVRADSSYKWVEEEKVPNLVENPPSINF